MTSIPQLKKQLTDANRKLGQAEAFLKKGDRARARSRRDEAGEMAARTAAAIMEVPIDGPAQPPPPPATKPEPEPPIGAPLPLRLPEPGDWIGGPPGAGGAQLVQGKTFRGTVPKPKGPVDFLDCDFLPGSEMAFNANGWPRTRILRGRVIKGRPPERAEGHGTHLLYFHFGLKPTRCGLVIQGLVYEDCEATTAVELKGSHAVIADIEARGCRIRQGIRVRHGEHNLIARVRGLPVITLRGWRHAVLECPDSTVSLLAGNMDARWEQWQHQHKPGGGKNFQTCEDCYVQAVKEVLVGHPTGGVTNSKPALRCVVPPGQGGVQSKTQSGLRRAGWSEWAGAAEIAALIGEAG